ncbi:MAG: tetratricopeptide repeat protein [Planctomycetota bacterium]|jgi:tetratricopeptide (TPR) repeat protein
MSLERQYLFRHAMTRDAVYQLQTPSDRSEVHAVAFELLQKETNADSPEFDFEGNSEFYLHDSDSYAAELAEHALLAPASSNLDTAARHYLVRAAEYAELNFQNDRAEALWMKLAEQCEASSLPEVLRRAAQSANLAGHAQRSLDLLASALELAGESAVLRGKLFGDIGNRRREMGLSNEAEKAFEEAFKCHKSSGDERMKARTLSGLASLYQETGRVEQAEDTYKQAIDLHQQAADRKFIGVTRVNLGNLYVNTSRMREADACYTEALAQLELAGDTRTIGSLLVNMATMYSLTGRTKESIETYDRALKLTKESGNRKFEGVALGKMAGVLLEDNRTEEAEVAYQKSLSTLRDVGNARFEGVMLGNLARLYQRTERPDDAERLHRQALEIHERVGNRRSKGVTLTNLAGLLQESGRSKSALEAYEEALEIHRDVGNRRFEAIVHCDRALVYLLQSRMDDARTDWQAGRDTLLALDADDELARKTEEMRRLCNEKSLEPLDA